MEKVALGRAGRGRRAPAQASHVALMGRPFKAWVLCHCPGSLEFLSDVTFASYHLIHFSSCLWEIGSGLGRALCV